MENHFNSILKIKLNDLKHELLVFPVFCHLLYCVRSSKVPGRCQKCTIIFVKDTSIRSRLVSEFYPVYLRRKNFSKSLFELFQSDKEEYFNIDLFYYECHFLTSADQNFGCLCFEAINEPYSILDYNSILDYIFDLKQVENISNARHLREFYFRKISEIAIRNLASLHRFFNSR